MLTNYDVHNLFLKKETYWLILIERFTLRFCIGSFAHKIPDGATY